MLRILLFTLAISGILKAQMPLPFTFDQPVVFNSQNGLPSDQVNTLVKDHLGFIWIGTREGLARFDGHQFDIFQHRRDDTTSIPNNWIEALLLDHNNRLWIGTSRGLCYYRPESRSFAPLPTAVDSLLIHERIHFLHQDQSKILWIGTPNRLVRLDLERDSLTNFAFSVQPSDTTFDIARIKGIQSITSDEDQEILWVGTQSGLVKFNKSNHKYTWYPNYLPNQDAQYLANAIRRLHQLPNGKLLIGSWNGAYLFDPYSGEFKAIRPPDLKDTAPFRSTVISFLSMPAHGLVGITYRTGFCWYSYTREEVETTWVNNALEELTYSAQLVDRQQRIWGVHERGLFQYNPLINQIREHKIPFRNPLYAVMPRSIIAGREPNQYYIAALAFNGLITWDSEKDSWDVIPPPPGETWNSGIQDMIRLNNGRIILASNHKLFELLEDQQRILPIFTDLDFGKPAFRRMVEGTPNELWIGSRRAGLYRLQLNTADLRVYREELDKDPGDIRHRWIENIYKDSRGQIWIRTAFEYSVYLPKRDTFIHWDSYGRPPGEDFPIIVDFQEDQDGNMWLAGEQFGLGMASVHEVEKGVIKIFSTQDGLPPFDIGHLGLDQKGYLWMEHESGITRFDPHNGQARYFSPGYGVPQTINEFITPIDNGRLAISTNDGIAVFDPKDLKSNQELPVPYLTSFKVFDRELKNMDSPELIDKLRLSYRQNFFSFEFSSLAFNLPDQVRFRYRLDGFDQQWNESGKRRYAAYTNIPGGDYVFRLEAANNEGEWNHEALEVPIRITTPWWKSLWFWLPFLSLSLSAGILAIRWRIRQVRQQEKLKSEFDKKLVATELHALRAQMNPHFIFNCLNSIDYYIIKNETEKASDYLNRFSRLIRLILQNSRAEYVNLKDELEALKLYMEMESLRFDDRFEYIVRIGSGLQLDNLEIPPLLLQPYVENAIWHGLAKKSNGKNRLDLTITRNDQLLHCRIEDNGIGREAAREMKSASTGKHRSMGMYLTRDRLHRINRMHNAKADVQITDLKDEQGSALGTRVDIMIPVR